jgi:hypothetical protein
MPFRTAFARRSSTASSAQSVAKAWLAENGVSD